MVIQIQLFIHESQSYLQLQNMKYFKQELFLSGYYEERASFNTSSIDFNFISSFLQGVVRPTGGYAVMLNWSMSSIYGLKPGEVIMVLNSHYMTFI